MEQTLQTMLEAKANEIRKLTIEEIGRLSVGHIGGSVDLCELLAVLYFHAMHIDPQDPRLPERTAARRCTRRWPCAAISPSKNCKRSTARARTCPATAT